GAIRGWLARMQGVLEPASVGRKLAAVRSCYRWLLKKGQVAANPAALVATPKKKQALPRVLPIDEVFALLDTPRAESPLGARDRAMLEVLYGSGLRCSELVGMSLSSMDRAAHVIRVLGKGDKERVVPLGRKAWEALEAWLAMRPRLLARLRSGQDPEALFVNYRGGRLSTEWVGRMLDRWSRLCGLRRHVHPHALRHSFATHLL